MFFHSLKTLVKKNSLLWGKDVADAYHGAASRDMNAHWSVFVQPVLDRHPINFTRSIDFACGYGRNTDKLLELADHVTMIDVNQENIEHCQKKYAGNPRTSITECNGYDLRNVASETCTFFYTFDSMVHFPPEIVKSYLPEFYRVMSPSGYAFIHHSNYTQAGPKKDFRQNPHWRNYMSAEIFADLARAAGFTVIEQTFHDWGVPNLDCISLLKKA